MSVGTSTSTPSGPNLSLTVLTARPHPRVVTALHLVASITETLRPMVLATYTVRVTGSNAAACGSFPILIVASTFPQPLVTPGAVHDRHSPGGLRVPFAT